MDITPREPMMCPTCDSPEKRLHPAVSGGGEVTKKCLDAWHNPNRATDSPQVQRNVQTY